MENEFFNIEWKDKDSNDRYIFNNHTKGLTESYVIFKNNELRKSYPYTKVYNNNNELTNIIFDGHDYTISFLPTKEDEPLSVLLKCDSEHYYIFQRV